MQKKEPDNQALFFDNFSTAGFLLKSEIEFK